MNKTIIKAFSIFFGIIFLGVSLCTLPFMAVSLFCIGEGAGAGCLLFVFGPILLILSSLVFLIASIRPESKTLLIVKTIALILILIGFFFMRDYLIPLILMAWDILG